MALRTLRQVSSLPRTITRTSLRRFNPVASIPARLYSQNTHDNNNESLVLSSTQDGVCSLTLNRPQARNALSTAMLLQLQARVHEATHDHNVRCVVVKGNGPVFCSGHDLKEMIRLREIDKNEGSEHIKEVFTLCSSVMQAIAICPKPTLARVHGVATAAGCQLVASTDLAIAADTARFGTPGVNIGLFCSTPSVALSRCVGRRNSLWMLLTGELITADRALEWGLVNETVGEEELEAATMRVATLLASKSTEAIGIGKSVFNEQVTLGLEDAYACATPVMASNMLLNDAGEGIKAFIEKRHPQWPSHTNHMINMDGSSKL